MNPNPQTANPRPHHLNIHDMDRAMADNNHSAHLHCHEDDCFIEDSELNASDAAVMEDTHPPTPNTKAP